MTYMDSYIDSSGPTLLRDSSSEIAIVRPGSHYRYFWEVRRDASSNSVNLTLATDDEPPYIDSRVNMTDHVRHGQHQDTGAGSDGRDDVAGQDLPAVSTGNPHPRITRAGGIASFMGRQLPPGPWHAEPDHEEFRSPHGLPCILHRSGLGAWCGYVGVPPGHPWHSKDYGDLTDPFPEVHGGLTYSDRCQDGGPICHVPRPGESDDVWWLGFDCNHSGDLSLYDVGDAGRPQWSILWPESYKTIGYVRSETLKLAEQAHVAASGDTP